MPEQKSSVRYLSHPEVVIDPSACLNDICRPKGRACAKIAVRKEWLRNTMQIISSAERKAIETDEIIAAQTGIEVEIREATHENDRSATGVLSQAEFLMRAEQFFAPHDKHTRYGACH